MALVVRCRDVGVDCDWEARGETEEELLQKAAQHGKEVHGIEPSPEIAEKLRQVMRRE